MSEASGSMRERLAEGHIELLRVISKGWVNEEGVVNPAAFNLSAADRNDLNRLSIARGVAVTPEQAYADRAAQIEARCQANGKKFSPPAGVMVVTVGDVESAQIETAQGCRTPLTAWDDSMNSKRSRYHGHIDFNEVPADDRGLCLFAAKALLSAAKVRGWKFIPAQGAE